ncbi:histidine kinase [Dokdonia sp.]|uniref:histidine kinase n=1 Tax=Dokdonia sp. TaxID=2024995 RepID=UPI003262F88B
MKVKVLFFLIFFCITNISFSQETTQEVFDPEVVYTQAMIDTIVTHHRRRIKELKSASELKKMLESNNKLSGWIYYNFYRAIEFSDKKQYDSVVEYADRGIQAYKNSKNKREFEEEMLLYSYYYKGRALGFLQRFEEAIESNQIALDYTKKYPYKWKSFIVTAIANNHLDIGNDSIALDYYLDTTKDSLFMTLARSAVTTYTRIGTIYSKSYAIEKARLYFSEAIKRSETSNYKRNLWVLYNNLGDIHYYENNVDSTLFYYKKAINHYDDTIETQSSTIDQLNLLKGVIELYEGDVYISIKYLNSIKEAINEKERISKEEKEQLMQVYLVLGEAYQKTNNITELKAMSQESNRFLEDFYKKQSEINLDNIEVKYKTKEKDISIASLEKTTQSQETIIKQRNTINWILGGLLLSFIGLGYLFYRQRRLQNHYKTSNLEQRLLRSQLNPHFLFNALNSVSGLVQKKSDQTIPYISRLGNLLRSILENSREEFISLEEELETITSYLELQSNFSKKFTFEIQVIGTLNKEEILIPPMFLQPFIENAIDHGFQGKDDENITITVDQKLKDQVLYFSIEDNGVGYSSTMKSKEHTLGHQSLSGTILKERLALYAKSYKSKALYTIEDISQGTKVHLYLPYQLDL